MASPNPGQAEKNTARVDSLATDIYGFYTYQDALANAAGWAQELFNEAVSLASDTASTQETVTMSSDLASMLHQWVVKPGKLSIRSQQAFAERRLQMCHENPKLFPGYVATSMYLFYRGETELTEAPFTPKEYLEALQSLREEATALEPTPLEEIMLQVYGE